MSSKIVLRKKIIVSFEVENDQKVNNDFCRSFVTLSGAFYAQKRNFQGKLIFFEKKIRHFRHFLHVISVILFRHFDRKFWANQIQLQVKFWRP